MVCAYGSMHPLAEEAIVPRRYQGRDQLALARRQGIRSAKKNVGELVEGFGGLRPEHHQPSDARQILSQL
jgi:hypothetical protein